MQNFFEKVAGGINKGFATVGANSKALVERTQVNAAIGNLEAEKKQLLQLMGQRVYELRKTNVEISSDEGIANFVSEIDKRLALIEEQKERLRRIEEEVNMVTKGTVSVSQGGITCQCGHTTPNESKFCTKCGSEL